MSICKHFIKIKERPLEFIPKGNCGIDNSECTNPYVECVITSEKKNKQLFSFVK